MTDPYFQRLFAERIGGINYGKGTEIYKFEKIKRAKRAALKEHPERQLLDFGIGENDNMAAEVVRNTLKVEVNRLENRGYADNGIQEFKDAAAEFMERELGVAIDPLREVNHCIGSKSALAIIPAAFINPGDITLMTVPGYPVAGTHTRYYGGEVHRLPLTEANGFRPDLGTIPEQILDHTKLLVLNFPNSPTGAVADRDFYLSVVEFAQKHRIVVVQDAAHILLTFGEKPLSFLSIPGAKDVGIEIHSLSKGFDMIGWRMGFVCGNERIVQAFADLKDNTDSGQFIAVQKAAAKALRTPDIPGSIRAKYQRRLKKLVDVLNAAGFGARMPGGSYFLYTRAPSGTASGLKFATAEEASQYLIHEHSICTVPWDDAGAYLRFSVTYEATDDNQEDALMDVLAARLSTGALRWSS